MDKITKTKNAEEIIEIKIISDKLFIFNWLVKKGINNAIR